MGEESNAANVRWSWGKFPSKRIDGSRMVIPLGCLYTPLANECPQLPYPALRCASCHGILNRLCAVDHRSKTWGCCVCNTRNSFPPHYANMSEQHLPMELWKQYDTVEFTEPETKPTTFALVIDTCVDTESEFEALKQYVLLALSKIPEWANVCLITYGATVQIHDLSGSADFNRSVVLRGSVEITPETLGRILKSPGRFVRPFSEAEFTITSLVEDLQLDLWPVQKDFRPLRCTGAAVSAAASLLDISLAKGAGLVMTFVSGVCTEGPGCVVDCNRAVYIRGHHDLRDSTPTAKHWDKSTAFYDGLMRRMVSSGHSLSLFVGALDQSGVAEMKVCVQSTGGVVISVDSWKRNWIRQSLTTFMQRRSDGTFATGLNATFTVLTSPTWKVMGVIGCCIGTGKRSSCVAESELGMGGTCQWTASAVDPRDTMSVFFEPENAPPPQGAPPCKPQPQHYRYVQFITRYQCPGAGMRTRVTTLPHLAIETVNFQELGSTFDQQVAAALMARIAIHKTDGTALFDVLRWLDRHVIRLVARFGEYTKDQPQSLKLSPTFSMFPAFMYHLRRSAYLSVFNTSPDETAVMRLLFLRADVNDAIVMLQPTLFSYTLQAAPQPVALDASSLQPDNILLLDTFFEVLIYHGETIAAWKEMKYDEQEEYAYFKRFLQAPRDDAQLVVQNRFPTPRFIECGPSHGDSRILKNRINPSRTHNTVADSYGANQGELVYTDDAPLQTFMEHLKKLAVQQ